MSSLASSQSSQSQAYLDEYIGDDLINTAIAFMCVETFVVALRFISKRLQRAKLGWDDYLIIPALIVCFGNCILGILAVQHGGVGRHITYVKQHPELIEYWYKTCLIATPVFYVVAACLPKITILMVYLRVFVEKPSRIACYVLLFVVVANCIGNIFSLTFKCWPISYGWDPTTPGGWCADVEPRLRYSSLFNIITDVGMLVLPIPVIWKLHTSAATKAGLACVFATGSVGLITSILRFIAFFSTEAFNDGTWASVDLVQWCIIEPGVYLIAACLVAYRPLVVFVAKETPMSYLLSKGSGSYSLSKDPNSRLGAGGKGNVAMDTFGSSKVRGGDSRHIKPLESDYGAYFAKASMDSDEHSHARDDGLGRIQVEHKVSLRSDPGRLEADHY